MTEILKTKYLKYLKSYIYSQLPRWRLDSNIESKSLNNSFLKLIKIFNKLYFCKDAPGVDGGLADDSMSLTKLPL